MRVRALSLSVGFAVAVFAGQCLAAQTMSILVGGQQRTYVISRPSGSGPRPTLLMLHGTGTNAAEFARANRLGAIGQREGFMTVYPDTVDQQWWNPLPPGFVPKATKGRNNRNFGDSDDVAYIKTLVGDVIRRGIADPKRIYIAGMSFGGFMALRMACMSPELFAAVGIIYSSMPEPTGDACQPAKPLPLVVMNGTADRVLPYSGGPTRAGFSVWSTDRTLAFFRRLDSCEGLAAESKLPHTNTKSETHVIVSRWTECARGPVVLYQVVGGGHQVHGSLNTDFIAYEALWAFFRDLKNEE